MDISKIQFSLNGELLWGFSLLDDDDKECDYVSGSLVISAIDNSRQSMTLKFNDLKMSDGRVSYTFNGTIKLPFSLWGIIPIKSMFISDKISIFAVRD